MAKKIKKGLNQTQLAQHLGVSQARVAQLVGDGRLPRLSDGSFDPGQCEAAYQGETRPKIAKTDRQTGDVNDQYLAARAKREQENARQAEIKTAQIEGRLLDSDRVRSACWTAARNLRDSLLTLPVSLSPRLVNLSESEIRSALDSAIRSALESASQALENVAAESVEKINDNDFEDSEKSASKFAPGSTNAGVGA